MEDAPFVPYAANILSEQMFAQNGVLNIFARVTVERLLAARTAKLATSSALVFATQLCAPTEKDDVFDGIKLCLQLCPFCFQL